MRNAKSATAPFRTLRGDCLGVSELPACAQLVELNLRGCARITDLSVAPLPELCPQLRKLCVTGSSVSEEVARLLQGTVAGLAVVR